MKKNNPVYFRGIPIAPDVQRLLETFGEPEEKTFISHEKVAAILREEYMSNRYKSVTRRWRDLLLREHNVLVNAVPGEGFIVADPSSRITTSGKKMATAKRAIRKSATIAAHTDRARLTDEEKSRQDKYTGMQAVLAAAERTQAKELPSGR